MQMLLLLKLAVPPVLVAVISLAARAWGPTVGALLMGLPWLTGPVLFFLTLDKGTEFGVGACAGILLGVVCLCAYLLVWGVASAVLPWPLCLAVASAAFAAAGWATRDIHFDLVTAAGLAALCLVLLFVLLPRAASKVLPAPLPWWDIPARMLATVALVGVISISADLLGARLSGVVATFPVIVSVVGAFTHSQWGRDAVRHMLRGLAVSLQAFVAFFLVVGLALPAAGLVYAYVLAVVAALVVSSLVLVASR